jgi:hypothetical protein
VRYKSGFSLSLLVMLFAFASSSLARSQCVTSSDTGSCPSSGAYPESGNLSESNGSNTYVDNDVSGGYGVSPETQTLTATSGSSWSVSADFGSSTHQLAYPYTLQGYAGEAVSSFTNIVGTFNETTPHNSSTEEMVGFLVYLNNWGNEFEIQHDMVNTSQCGGTTPVQTDVSFGGSYGVPSASWDLCYNGSIYYWQLVSGGDSTWGTSSSSVELISMTEYLEDNGYLPSSSTISDVRYGFIIYTTDSTQETFTLNSYSLINNASSSSPTISLSPTSLGFSATAGGSNPASQNVSVSNSGGGTLESPTTQITYSQGSGWLSVDCTGSSAPYTCSTQPTTGSLAAGTYNATVQVSSSGASNSPQSYTVAFTVNSGSACEITTAMGTCGPYYDTSLTSTDWGQITQNDVWNPPSSWTQDLYTTSPGDWYAILNFPTDSSGAIHTYPSSAIQWSEDGEGGVDYEDPTLDSFSEIITSWSESVPSSSTGTVTDVGFDNWMNDWGNEVMVQTQMVNTAVCTGWTTVIATDVQFGGSNGVPVGYWNLCQNGTFTSSSNPELIWQYYAPSDSENFGESSGTIDLYSMLKYLEGNDICKTATGTTDCLPAGSTFTQTTLGMEVNGTAGTNQQFTLSSWTMTYNQ